MSAKMQEINVGGEESSIPKRVAQDSLIQRVAFSSVQEFPWDALLS